MEWMDIKTFGERRTGQRGSGKRAQSHTEGGATKARPRRDQGESAGLRAWRKLEMLQKTQKTHEERYSRQTSRCCLIIAASCGPPVTILRTCVLSAPRHPNILCKHTIIVHVLPPSSYACPSSSSTFCLGILALIIPLHCFKLLQVGRSTRTCLFCKLLSSISLDTVCVDCVSLVISGPSRLCFPGTIPIKPGIFFRPARLESAFFCCRVRVIFAPPPRFVSPTLVQPGPSAVWSGLFPQ
ncbi:hypothetical protein F4777DRAFT_347000 [Nemania sp. FL0916]|nr:hypothetical protein F4777DRAFT_347000 [Nemania sp. FL0916]